MGDGRPCIAPVDVEPRKYEGDDGDRQYEREDSANVEDLVAEPRAVLGYILDRLADRRRLGLDYRSLVGRYRLFARLHMKGRHLYKGMVMVVGWNATV